MSFRSAFTLIYIFIFGSVPLGLKIILYPLIDSNSITLDFGNDISSVLFSIIFFLIDLE